MAALPLAALGQSSAWESPEQILRDTKADDAAVSREPVYDISDRVRVMTPQADSPEEAVRPGDRPAAREEEAVGATAAGAAAARGKRATMPANAGSGLRPATGTGAAARETAGAAGQGTGDRVSVSAADASLADDDATALGSVVVVGRAEPVPVEYESSYQPVQDAPATWTMRCST